jgi:hypothetical protein
LTIILEDIFTAIKIDHPNFTQTIPQNDGSLTWFFEQAEGNFNNRNGSVLFYHGVEMPAPKPSFQSGRILSVGLRKHTSKLHM